MICDCCNQREAVRRGKKVLTKDGQPIGEVPYAVCDSPECNDADAAWGAVIAWALLNRQHIEMDPAKK